MENEYNDEVYEDLKQIFVRIEEIKTMSSSVKESRKILENTNEKTRG